VVTFAVLALAGAVVSLATLRGVSSTTSAPATPSTVDVAALSQQSPLALPLAGGLTQASGTVAGAVAPLQAAAPAVPAAQAAPAPAATSSTEMGATSSDTTSCVGKGVLQPILDHIKSAHLETSPGQQVSDALNLDQYVKTHTVWLENVLKPVMDGSADKVVTDTLAPILAHIQSAHLETSPGQQVSDALNLDQYLKTHTVWLENVLTPLMAQATC
jgi:hypothetical protein